MDRTKTLNPILPGAGVPRSAAGVQACPHGQYDGTLSNPTGRSGPEKRKRYEAAKASRKILRCKRPIRLSTFNVRTLKVSEAESNKGEKVMKNDELYHHLEQNGIEICGIQETRLKHEKERRNMLNSYPSASGYTLYTVSAWENDRKAATGGIGLILGKTSHELLKGVERVSDRILIAKFRGNPAMTVIVAYAPTESADDTTKDEYFGKLRTALDSVPLHDFLAVLTDANARFGPDDAQNTYNEVTNSNGRLHLEIMEEYKLEPANTLFEKRRGKLWTWRSPQNTLHQIDYVLVRSKWRNSVKNCEAYSSFNSLNSDHRVVTASVSLSLRSTKPDNNKNVDKFIWSDLASNVELQMKYKVEVKNRYQALQEIDDEGSVIPDYNKFVTASAEAAKECLRKVPRTKKKKKSLDPRVKAMREEVEEAYRMFLSNGRPEELRERYKEKVEDLYKTYAIIDQEELLQKVVEAENAHESMKHREAWRLINEISGRKKAQSSKLKANSPEERVQLWHTHFNTLLGSPPSITDDVPIESIFSNLDISTDPFSADEYVKGKNSLRSGKACGEDGITPEFLKYAGLDDDILGFLNEAFLEGHIQEKWKTLIIIPVPKSGDLSKPDNYRGISLISLVMKLYNRMLLNRLRPAIDPLLRINQNGFRQKRTTVGQILALRRLLEGVKEKNLSCVMTFIDFRKAFDSIHRGKLMDILRAYGVPEKVVSAIAATYSETWAKVRTPDGDTEPFQILAGVLQGDTLAPFLFIIALDYALRCAISGREEELGFTLKRRASRRVPAKMMTDLDFADDISLLSDTVEKACMLLSEVERHCNRIGLSINAKKTKVMPMNTVEPVVRVTTLDGTPLEVVDDYIYLGACMASTQQDIKVRRAKAWRALHNMSKVWRSSMTPDTKRRLFVSTVESVLLYGCEAWTLTVADEKALDGLYTRMLRRALDVTWEEHMRNVDLYGNLPRLTDKIRERRMRLAGHCTRHPELVASELVLWEPTHGTRSVGRRHTTYIDCLKRDTGLSNTAEVRTLMEDRQRWRDAIHDSRVGIDDPRLK